VPKTADWDKGKVQEVYTSNPGKSPGIKLDGQGHCREYQCKKKEGAWRNGFVRKSISGYPERERKKDRYAKLILQIRQSTLRGSLEG